MRHLALALLLLLPACGDDGHDHDHEEEVITTVILTLTAPGGGPMVYEFDDPDGDGGAAPTVDTLMLGNGTTYGVTVRFENRLESPAEDITVEISDEADQHQVFFTGSAVDGPASDQPGAPLTHTYADMDADGLPIGLGNSFTASSGSGDLVVTLRHLPPVNDVAAKTADLAGQVRTSGFDGLAGATDAQVTFPVLVAPAGP